MGRLLVATPLLAALLAAGCSDEKTTPADARVEKKRPWLDGNFIVPELAPDWNAPPDSANALCDSATLGKYCKLASDCETAKGMDCLHTSSVTNDGICVCKCRADDPKTTLNEDNCPEAAAGKNQCVTMKLSSGSTTAYCMHRCKPKIGANDCFGKVACDPWTAVNFDLTQPVCAYAGCTKPEDCPVATSTVCSVSKKDCPTGETCQAVLTGLDEGRCHRPGVCDLTSGLCDAHTLGKADAKVGDGCASDLDCAGNMRCLPELDEAKYYKKGGETCASNNDCCSRICDKGFCTKGVCTVLRRHGYCTISGCEYGDTLTIRACPQGSACNLRFYTGYCQKTCDPASATDCRGRTDEFIGDYECRRWGNLSSYMVTNTPVCDFGTQLRCTFFANSSYDCSILGADVGGKTNPLNMKCRGLDGFPAAGGSFDASGFCLDDTGSGSGPRSPLPTP